MHKQTPVPGAQTVLKAANKSGVILLTMDDGGQALPHLPAFPSTQNYSPKRNFSTPHPITGTCQITAEALPGTVSMVAQSLQQ